jgi:hypothetical protein
MAYEQPQKMPADMDELDAMCGRVYKQGVEAGKTQLRQDIKDYLLTKFFGARGDRRRADPKEPKVQAIRELTEGLYAKFEDGTL